MDFNPNKQYMLATTGDDGGIRFWDIRHSKLPVQIRSDHSHWTWSVKFNQCHDQVRVQTAFSFQSHFIRFILEKT